MAAEPTEEQQAARDVFAAGRDLALVAGAGTGKTSTLVLMGAATRRRGMYIAFNRSIADEARRRFGPNVKCGTAHSLAHRAVGHRYQHRLDADSHIPTSQAARILGIRRDLLIGSRPIRIEHQTRLVMGMIRRFCYSSDRQVMAGHMEPVNGLDQPAHEYLSRTLLSHAVRAWDDICSRNGVLRFHHDHYLKMWAMTEPVLPADFVLLDEAQDTNPVLEEVFLAQDTQRVCVGDPAQQIYAWRSARDVMTGFPAEHLSLTRSFRFGPRIAAVANRWLRHAGSDMELEGHGPGGSGIGRLTLPDVVLCRGNEDAMQEVLAYLDDGVPVALIGGGETLRKIAEAAEDLKAGRRTRHPELFLFSSWGEVQDYAEYDIAGQELRAIVELVDKYGPEKIIQAVNRLSAEQDARVAVSTVHKAKGREWNDVRIGNGFTAPSVDEDGRQRELDPAEARVIYVAVSRARRRLDLTGLAWADKYEKSMVRAPGRVAGRPMIDLSLTAQLMYGDSPVSRFMAARLPESRRVANDYQRRLAGLPYPVQPINVRRPDWSSLGHAIDYRLRLSFGGDLGPAVRLGVQALGGARPFRSAPERGTRAALHAAGRRLLTAVDTCLADPGYLGDEMRTRLCFVAAFFEQLGRTGQIADTSMLAAADPSTDLGRLTAAVPRYVIDDIAAQLRLAEEPLAAFRALPPQARVCGPEFAGSADIGGADADYVLGGLLLDCKSTRNPRRLGRAEVYQLAGYLLLDYDDRFGIDRVGLYLSRQGGLVVWEVGDFLGRLGAGDPLPRLRERLRDHLRDAARRQARGPRNAHRVAEAILRGGIWGTSAPGD